MNYVVADGKSNWLEGMILVCKLPSLDLREISTQCHLALYVIIGVAFWFYPGTHLMSLNSRITDFHLAGSAPLEHLSRCPVPG